MGCLARAAASRLKRFVKLITEHHVSFPHSEFNIYWATHELTNTDYSGLMDSHWLHIKVSKTWNHQNAQRPPRNISLFSLIVHQWEIPKFMCIKLSKQNPISIKFARSAKFMLHLSMTGKEKGKGVDYSGGNRLEKSGSFWDPGECQMSYGFGLKPPWIGLFAAQYELFIHHFIKTWSYQACFF